MVSSFRTIFMDQICRTLSKTKDILHQLGNATDRYVKLGFQKTNREISSVIRYTFYLCCTVPIGHKVSIFQTHGSSFDSTVLWMMPVICDMRLLLPSTVCLIFVICLEGPFWILFLPPASEFRFTSASFVPLSSLDSRGNTLGRLGPPPQIYI